MMHPPMPAQFYQPQPNWTQQMAAPPQQGQQQQGGEIRTLWIGDLQYWMDENYLNGCFASTGEVTMVKVIRNKQTGHSEGYGFVEFASRSTADRVLQSYSGQTMPNVNQVYKLNWASCSGSRDKFAQSDRDSSAADDHTIFVGDLAADVSDTLLQETFKSKYNSVKSAKVVIDKVSGRPKGYGFVKFDNFDEMQKAMSEMNGQFCSSRQMRIGPAANSKKPGFQFQNSNGGNNNQNGNGNNDSDSDPNNTTVFVGGIDTNSVNEESLKQVFSPYGEIVYVKIPANKRCGFVQFSNRASAEEALRELNGTVIGGQSVRLSWGRSLSNKQPQQEAANQWNGAGGAFYGYGQGGYENYGYAPQAQQQNMYSYGGYSAYGNYQQQQQQVQQQQQ
ncbi:hypothetical protein LUZ60_010766 [Juncus effusus]|nr:hypothetical protein LUZ60_010766 [Juncus effusus]